MELVLYFYFHRGTGLRNTECFGPQSVLLRLCLLIAASKYLWRREVPRSQPFARKTWQEARAARRGHLADMTSLPACHGQPTPTSSSSSSSSSTVVLRVAPFHGNRPLTSIDHCPASRNSHGTYTDSRAIYSILPDLDLVKPWDCNTEVQKRYIKMWLKEMKWKWMKWNC